MNFLLITAGFENRLKFQEIDTENTIRYLLGTCEGMTPHEMDEIGRKARVLA